MGGVNKSDKEIKASGAYNENNSYTWEQIDIVQCYNLCVLGEGVCE